MDNFPNKKDRQIVLYSWLFCFVMASFSSIVLLAFQNFYSILCEVVFVSLTIFLSVLVKRVSKNHKLKYIFKRKEYNELFKKSLEKFKGASDDFIKELKTRTYESFSCDGVLYYKPTLEETKWLFRDESNKFGFLTLIEFLIKSIDNGQGFIWYIEETKKFTNNPRLNFFTLYNEFLSGELRYLIVMVFDLTEFDLTDNHMSIEYTDNLKKTIDIVNKVYTPLLFNFKEELENVIEYFKETQVDTIV